MKNIILLRYFTTLSPSYHITNDLFLDLSKSLDQKMFLFPFMKMILTIKRLRFSEQWMLS